MKIFLTGATGLLGSNILATKLDSFEIIASYRSKSLVTNHPNIRTSNIDLTDIDQVRKTLCESKCKLVINSAGYTNVNGCEQYPEKAHKENVLIAQNLAIVTHELGLDFIHISSDHLFSGQNELSNEKTQVSPINEYARSKVQAEEVVKKENNSTLIIRTNFYGWGPLHRNSFSDWIINALTNNEAITMYTNLFYTPINVNTLIDTIFELYEKDAQGIYNVVGDDRISKYDFGKLLAKEFHLDEKLISKGLYNSSDQLIKRPEDMSLSNSKVANLLKHSVENIESGINKLKETQGIQKKVNALFKS
ncbi:NAD(P)-dependent oxidoreductase [Halobacteriovorax sp. HLS]|uniref:SDR family oxidoreductase n=1 Tax=Halobacteriovorax sp. HLS TaxID=2234000 RepID=UPI000FDA8594|nr:NAD(P)-dependent oxidoreductase [Halobacteriovorax sp. HLS]